MLLLLESIYSIGPHQLKGFADVFKNLTTYADMLYCHALCAALVLIGLAVAQDCGGPWQRPCDEERCLEGAVYYKPGTISIDNASTLTWWRRCMCIKP
jgi:hypothetical protein